MMKGNYVLALICRTFHRVLSQGFWGIIYLTAGCYNMQPNIATRWGNLKNAVYMTASENIAQPFVFLKAGAELN